MAFRTDPSKNITPFDAVEKIKNWCAYRERSQNETRQKLLEYKLSAEQADNIIVDLIGENFLNEERFATAYAGGKFRIKLWGKIKIKQGLRMHKVSDVCINKALQSIDGNEYQKVIIKVIEKKLRTERSGDRRKKYYSVLKHATARGFESDLVIDELNVILEGEKEL